jgi:hypothetical protein
MGEEKETSTPSRPFSRFENHLPIETWMQRLVYRIKGQTSGFVKRFERLVAMERYFDISSDFLRVFLSKIH